MKSQNNRLKNSLTLIVLALIAVLLGYLRDSIFKTINALLRAWDLSQDFYLPNYLTFLENFEYNTLVNLKWALTLVFSILYLFLSIFAIKWLFNNKKQVNITIFTYLAIIFLSGVFISIGLLWDASSDKMYEFARYLMGMAQSPIILMLLIPAFKLAEKENMK